MLYEEMLLKIQELVVRFPHISGQECKLLDKLVLEVEAYEDTVYPIQASTPARVFNHLMDARSLLPVDFVGVAFDTEKDARDVSTGIRGMTSDESEKLGKYFNLPTELFILKESNGD